MSNQRLNLMNHTVGYRGVGWEEMDFPDGQPGIMLDQFSKVTPTEVFCRIASPRDLLLTELACDVLNDSNCPIDLTISYLMGGRMDRPISRFHPFTLDVVARHLRNIPGLRNVAVFDPHSDVTSALLRAKVWHPDAFVEMALKEMGDGEVTLVAPDVGASKKVERLADRFGRPWVQCLKHRDPETGKLTNIRLADNAHLAGQCLIVDDICDGGRTFTPVATALRNIGATGVSLYVSHGIFSNGLPLPGIDHVYTTDSYRHDFDAIPGAYTGLTMFPLTIR